MTLEERIVRDIPQGSPEWLAMRVGKIGGSRIADLFTEYRDWETDRKSVV